MNDYGFPKLPSTIDRLTSEGIIDFDAESYYKGTQPRYIGAPKEYLPFDEPLPARRMQHYGPSAKLHDQPHHDELVKHEESKTPEWKKILTGSLVLALIAAAGYKLTKGGSKIGQSISNGTKTSKDWIKNTFNKVFKRTPNP